jgi:hypothetical protein
MGFANGPVREYSDVITTASANPAPATAVVGVALPGLSREAAIQLSGTFVATVQFEASIDGGKTWSTVAMTPSAGGSAVTSATAAGLFVADVRPYAMIQARGSAYTSGSVSVTIRVG